MNSKILVFAAIVAALCIGSDAKGIEHKRADCNRICETNAFEIPVCGTDGVLYTTMCEFEMEQCKALARNISLKIASTSICINVNTSCDEISNVNAKCEHPAIDLLCGSDNITYENPCEFMEVKCRRNRHLDLEYTGPCNFDTSNAVVLDCKQYMNDLSNLAIEEGTVIDPQTLIHCVAHHDSLCLLGGITYHNGACYYCQMLLRRGQISLTNTQTYIEHTGRCSHGHIIG
ncbi:hypothetical protein ACF0H5_001823 [Mactra antiquata]